MLQFCLFALCPIIAICLCLSLWSVTECKLRTVSVVAPFPDGCALMVTASARLWKGHSTVSWFGEAVWLKMSLWLKLCGSLQIQNMLWLQEEEENHGLQLRAEMCSCGWGGELMLVIGSWHLPQMDNWRHPAVLCWLSECPLVGQPLPSCTHCMADS